MSGVLIDNARVLQPMEGDVSRSLLMRDGKVARIDPPPADVPAGAERLDAGGRLLTPGLIDMHTHGIGRVLFEQGPDALRTGLAALPGFGVTCVAPTLYTTLCREHLDRLRELAKAVADEGPETVPGAGAGGACVAGFHMEGPFLKLAGAGGFTFEGDVALLDDLIQAVGGRVTAMSISPDTENIGPVIRRLSERGIAVFMTHTAASAAQTQAAIEAGARHATHFYDVFPVPPVTDPGVRPVGAVEAILADRRVTVDFIGDGVHVDPVAIRAALAAKGPGGVMLITDGYLGAGLEPGVYHDAGPYAVRVCAEGGTRRHDPGGSRDGGLSGSNLTMDLGISNLLRWLEQPEAEVWAMATTNPARVLGLEQRKGTLSPDADADLVLWDHAPDTGRYTAAKTWVGGRCVFEAQPTGIKAET